MNTRFSLSVAAAIAAGYTAFANPVHATSDKEQEPIADCEKAVSILGASMGHKEITSGGGLTAYLFLVRANGFDYEVVCDAKSGVVSDVTPRQG